MSKFDDLRSKEEELIRINQELEQQRLALKKIICNIRIKIQNIKIKIKTLMKIMMMKMNLMKQEQQKIDNDEQNQIQQNDESSDDDQFNNDDAIKKMVSQGRNNQVLSKTNKLRLGQV